MLSDSYLDALISTADGTPLVTEAGEETPSGVTIPATALSTGSLTVTNEDDYQETEFSDDDDISRTSAASLEVAAKSDSSGTKIQDMKSPVSEVPLAVSVDGDYQGVNFREFKSLISKTDEMDELVTEYGYDKIFAHIDSDNDGVISQSELADLGLSTDVVDKLTVDDIKKIAKAAGLPEVEENKKDDETSVSDDDSELDPEIVAKLREAFGIGNNNNDNNTTTPEVTPAASAAPVYSSAPVYGSSGSGGGSYSGGGSSGASAQAAAQPEQLSMDELLQQQSTKQSEVDKAGADVVAVQNGQNENVAAAKTDCDEKEKAYEEALEKDEEVSEELKQEQKENQEQIDENNDKIEENEGIIAECDNTIKDCESQISVLDSQIKALNASKSALPAKTEDNKDKWSEIDAMAKQIEGKIEAAEKEKDDLNDKIDEAKEKKDDAQDVIDECKENLTELEKERDRIEKEILETCSEETKQALKDFQEARENIETVRAQELEKAQTALSTAQQELDKINDSIKELQEMQIQLENRVGDSGEDVVAFAEKLDGMSAAEMKQIMRAAGCQFDDGAWCADFVTYVTKQVYGVDSTPGDFAHSCSNTAYCPTIESWAQSKGVWTTNSADVQPGDYILYTRNGRAGHVGIVTSVNPDGSVNTIEGNTSDDNGHYTNGVVNQHTNVRNARGFVKMHELA